MSQTSENNEHVCFAIRLYQRGYCHASTHEWSRISINTVNTVGENAPDTLFLVVWFLSGAKEGEKGFFCCSESSMLKLLSSFFMESPGQEVLRGILFHRTPQRDISDFSRGTVSDRLLRKKKEFHE